MLKKSTAIVLHHIPYSDNGTIVHLYTRDEGRISVFVRGSGKRATLPPVLMQPFSVVELVLDSRPKNPMHYVKESRALVLFSSIPFDPLKSSITLFLTEVLYRATREPQADKHFFDFLVQSITFFDQNDRGLANFHLVFLIRMTYFLGFFPNVSHFGDNVLFDLQGGCFCTEKPAHPYFLDSQQAQGFAYLMRLSYQTMHLFTLSRQQRQNTLEQIMSYYRLHLPEFGQVRSLEILKQLFD